MALTQKNPVGNTVQASILQMNLTDLFQAAHTHGVRSALPNSQDGTPGDIVIVDTSSSVYICVKTSRGWFKTAALSAV